MLGSLKDIKNCAAIILGTAVGGGISAQPILVKQVNRAYDEIVDYCPLYKKTLVKPEIVTTKFKNDANLYGALYNLLVHVNGEKL